jgi:hypothetical protein
MPELRPNRIASRSTGLSAFGVLALIAACAPGDDAPPVPPSAADEGVAQFIASPQTAPDARGAVLRIVSPADGARFEEGAEVAVRFELEGYELRVPTPTGDQRGLARAPDGQHIHLIVNDRSYQAVYDLDEPVVLGDLPAGTHVIRAFPGRDWHESVKAPGAFDQVVIVIGDGPLESFVGENVIYSRPQGVYEGAAADSILVDFYVNGLELGPGAYQILFTLDDGQRFEVTDWQPYMLVGLADGEHTLRMEVFDSEGEAVNTPLLPVERTFEVRR